MTDLLFSRGGSVASCTVLSTAGMEWVDENVATESWQWMGTTFAVEPRYAPDLLAAAQRDGLECEV